MDTITIKAIETKTFSLALKQRLGQYTIEVGLRGREPVIFDYVKQLDTGLMLFDVTLQGLEKSCQ